MTLLELLSNIKSYSEALLRSKHSVFDKDDLDELMLIRERLHDMAKKYNPDWFKPMH